MGMALFSITDRNPNDYAGGSGGCMCSPIKTAQCRPPYCTFIGTEMLAPRSPIPVLSLHCAQQFVAKAAPAALEAAPDVQVQAPPPPPPAKARTARRTAL